jgi:hypothetical protein
MGAFIARQPNGLLCRFSTIVDTVTDYNMTEEEYIELCAEKAREEARNTIERHLRPFDWVKQYFTPNNMTEDEFNRILKEMSTEVST